MIDENSLKQVAVEFANSNPRFLDYGISFTREAIKSQFGLEIKEPEEMQKFLFHLPSW